MVCAAHLWDPGGRAFGEGTALSAVERDLIVKRSEVK
jgi:hypothetical protein